LALRFSAVCLVAFIALGFSLWLWWRLRDSRQLPLRRALSLLASGAAFAFVCTLIERWTLGFLEMGQAASARAGLGSAAAAILFFAPLEEALKVAAVWPSYLRRRLPSGRIGAAHALLAAGGFAFAESLTWFLLWNRTSWLDVLRLGIALPAHFFFAGAWGYMLGGRRRDRWFGAVWLGAVLTHGIYDHIVFGRGPGFLVVALPMLGLMVFGARAVLADGDRGSLPPSSSGRNSSISLLETPSLGAMREVMDRKGRPVMVHWILFGALVTLGVMLTFLAGAVYIGHRFGVDFALADEAGVEGATPIALLGAGLLGAFPFSAYLVARASGAVSVFEPAWATGAAIIVILALFSITEPTALIVALGIAPVGFALACAGAWFGLERP
jgi:hypothetical protein